jgi:hypothetical protein
LQPSTSLIACTFWYPSINKLNKNYGTIAGEQVKYKQDYQKKKKKKGKI